MRNLKISVLVGLLAGASGWMPLNTRGAAAEAAVVIIRHGPREAPPPLIEEHPAPRRGYVWVGGHHAYRHRRYHWMPGHYVRERPRAEYVPGHWDRHDDHYDWYDGGWHPRR